MTPDTWSPEAPLAGVDIQAAELLFKEARRRRRRRRAGFCAAAFVVLLAMAALATWAAGGPTANPPRGGVPDIAQGSFGPGPDAYVINLYGGITAINLDTRRVSGSLTLGESPFCRALRAGSYPPGLHKAFVSACRSGRGSVGDGLAIAPDGKTAYLATSVGVVRVDLTNGHAARVDRRLPGTTGAESIALAPDGATAYVTARTGEGEQLVEVDLASGTIGRRFDLPPGAADVAVTGDGRTAWITNGLSQDIYSLDLTTGKLGAPIAIPGGAGSIAISGDGRSALVTNTGDPPGLAKKTGKWRLEQKHAGYRYMTPVDLATRAVGAPITLYHGPEDVAIAPDGKTAYVATGGHGPPGPPGILVIDLTRGVESGTIRVPAGASQIAIP